MKLKPEGIDPERIATTILIFRTALGLLPEIQDILSEAALLHSPEVVDRLICKVTGSEEFRRLHGVRKHVDELSVRFFYRHGLGREPDFEGLKTALEFSDPLSVLRMIALSEEARNYRRIWHWLYPEGALPDDELACFLWLQWFETAKKKRPKPFTGITPVGLSGIDVVIQVGTVRRDLVEKTLLSLLEQNSDFPITVYLHISPLVPQYVSDYLEEKFREKSNINFVSSVGNQAFSWSNIFSMGSRPWVMILQPGDFLSSGAIERLSEEICFHNNALFIYSDTAYVGAEDHIRQPVFRPGWGRNMLLYGDFIGEFSVFRRACLKGLEWIEDLPASLLRYDLALRIADGLGQENVRHIPQVMLYSRSGHAGQGIPVTTSQFPGLQMICERYVQSSYPGVKVGEIKIEQSEKFQDIWPYISYPLLKEKKLVSVIIPTKNSPERLERCLQGLLEDTSWSEIEVIIVDNGSYFQGKYEDIFAIKRKECIRTLRMECSFNWSRLNNFGARHARGDFLLFLNDDIEVIPKEKNWLEELVRQAGRPNVGAVGARLLYPDGRLQHGGIALSGLDPKHIWRYATAQDTGYMGQLAFTHDVSAVTGACLMSSREIFELVGGFNESYPVTCNDLDYCFRVRASGHDVIWTPQAVLIHAEGATRGQSTDPFRAVREGEAFARLAGDWPAEAMNERFLNPHLEVTDSRVLLSSPH